MEFAPGASAAALREWGAGDFDGVWALDGGEMVTRHRDRSVFKVTCRLGGRREVLFVKRLGRAHLKSVAASLLSLERPLSKCLVEWEFARLLSAAGVSTAPMLAAGEVRLGPFPLESFLVTREIEGSRPLDEYLRDGSGCARAAGPLRRRLIEALAQTVAHMHSAGLFHRDLYAKHIFIRREGGEFVINVIDLQRMRTSTRERLAVRDLAALNVTLSQDAASDRDRLRFIAVYASCRWGGDGASKARRLIAGVLKRSRHISGRSKFRGINWRPRGGNENSDSN